MYNKVKNIVEKQGKTWKGGKIVTLLKDNVYTVQLTDRIQRTLFRDTLVKNGIPPGVITFVNFNNEKCPFKFPWHLQIYC